MYALMQSKQRFDLGTLVYVSHGATASTIQAAVHRLLISPTDPQPFISIPFQIDEV